MIPLSDYIYYSAGYKYQLRMTYRQKIKIYPEKDINTEYITLVKDGTLVIKRGYAWDGPSGPTIDTPSFMRGSLIHDALYQLMRMSRLDVKWRNRADIELHEACLEDGMWQFRADYVLKAVRAFAAGASSQDNLRPILMAPSSKRGGR